MKREGFPRFSLSGSLILALYLSIIKAAFDASIYGRPLYRTGKFAASSSAILNSLVASMSLLNALSHGAVVLGALHDTYVLSILVGVGFDVMTRIIQLVWWARLSMIAFEEHYKMKDDYATINDYYDIPATTSFLVALSFVYVFHMVIHVQALRMNLSHERLVKVLRSALNNLRGVAGNRYEDHIFAYSDLGGHLAPFWLSFYSLKQQQAILLGVWILVLWIVVSALILSRVPFNDAKKEINDNTRSFLRLNKGTIQCFCRVCKMSSGTSGECRSFTCAWNEGVCRLWLYSFEELSKILQGLPNRTESLKER